MSKYVVVIDHTNRHEDTPDSIDVYPSTPEGIEEAREKFCELVAEDLQEAEILSEKEALERAKDFLKPEGPVYQVGDGYIAYLEYGVEVHGP